MPYHEVQQQQQQQQEMAKLCPLSSGGLDFMSTTTAPLVRNIVTPPQLPPICRGHKFERLLLYYRQTGQDRHADLISQRTVV